MDTSTTTASTPHSRRIIIALVPLILFAALVALLIFGLQTDPRKVPSPLVGKPVPQFTLPELTDPGRNVSDADLKGKISLVNVWASWCSSCRAEHQALMALSDIPDFQIVGLNWKDDVTNAMQVLRLTGNPYDMNGYDPDNEVGIDWGVYGAPETFVVDKNGMIRYKHIGPIDRTVWEKTLQPLVAQLKAED
ncbi:MAG TPA: DsbE family thiol:disulfide interchange protein [Chromatiaceae bacterium]|jgi:cytochrome c biogenesis protein CcmG/thiol:disulfide interchange protein DsbE|nr:MAG: DsbE family thiol:disulfide interchange protein [Thiohalocapsa sp. PB-PSB1]HBG93946.1 DsbE family thiol:disulfide interchange protein [Chromatiaceae bacterium]HCS92143.1 DsbE family thiol:disulfide interchange protein [Chromatiaceae bacterium]